MNTHAFTKGAGLLLGALLTLPLLAAGDEKTTWIDVYPLDTCVVSGQKLGSMGDPVIRSHEGREVRFCCKGCVAKFEAEPAGFLKKIDEASARRQIADYPLDTCVVSGKKLGDSIDRVHKGRLVRFCCGKCLPAFEKDPDAFLGKLNKAAVAGQKAAYPLDACPVSGEKLGSMGDPVDVLVGGKLVRLCCAGCVGKVKADPAKYLDKVPNHTAPRSKESGGSSGCCGGH